MIFHPTSHETNDVPPRLLYSVVPFPLGEKLKR